MAAGIPQAVSPEAVTSGPHVAPRRRLLRRYLRNRAGIAGAVLIGAASMSAALAPAIAPADPYSQNLGMTLHGPAPSHWLGTDNLGRDLFSRVVRGGRITLPVAFAGVGAALVTGVPLGLVAGYHRGFGERIILRLTDVLLAFPATLLAIAITSALGVSLTTVSIAIAVFSMPVYVRLVRAEVLRLQEREFIMAARCVGATDRLIILRHLLPNALGPIIVQSSLNCGLAILTVSALSFLGLGAQPPIPEWGAMLADGRGYMRVAPHVVIFPGLAIMVAVLGFNLLGDGLRDAYDPRSLRM
ncbi:MAG TPA: ABC transporter permease [Tepidiformaceae bacterium]|nr:ABC transporter permease [Tepidiformaceae bacterium]